MLYYNKKSKISYLLKLIIYFAISIFFLETSLRMFTMGLGLNLGVLYSALFGSTFAILFGIVSYLVNKRPFTGFLTLVLSFLYSSQLVYFKIFRTFYIVYSAGNAGKVLEFTGTAFYVTKNNILYILFLFLPFFIFLVFNRRFYSQGKPNFRTVAIAVIIAVIIQAAGAISVAFGDKEINSPYSLYFNINHPEMSVENLGLLTYMRIDLQRSLTKWEPRDIPEAEQLSNEPIIYKPNIMDIDFETLLESETDSDLLLMHEYFNSVTPTNKNDYTGMFKDYNLVLITAESFSHLAIDKDLTPTLYKMYNEGFKFTNFYTAIWGVSTSDGEYTAMTGLIPKSGVWSFSYSQDNLLPFTMGNQLKRLGYITKAYHNNSFDYYDRDKSHPNAGYDYKGLGNGLEVTYTWPQSDLEMMELTIPEFIENEPFHAYYMSVSGHMLYSFEENFIADKNKSLVDDLDYPEPAKAYMATQIELDRALEYLMEQLEIKGIAEKTLIAISADHYPYALEQESMNALAGHEIEETFELYKNAFILYAKGMKPVVIDKPASSLDIIPTVSNLMGLDFDSRLLMGTDLFSNSDPLVILYDRSFISDKGRYDSRNDIFEPSSSSLFTNSEEEQLYREFISDIISEKFYFSSKILELDYYRKIFEK